MKIDKKKLIELLIEKTGMEIGEVEAQLDQLIARIVDAAERGKALEIKEFGLFYFDQNSELKFEPSEELSTEISFKYAGMKPVELKPERNTGIPADIDDLETEESEKEVTIVNKADRKQESADKEKSIPLSQKEVSSKPKAGIASRKPINRKKDRSFVWGILAFLLVLAIGAGIFYYMQSEETEQVTTTQQQPAQQTIEPSEPLPEVEVSIQDEAIVSDELTPINQQPEEPGTEQTGSGQVQLTQESDQPLYGLTGNWNGSVNNLYSIVVHSFYNQLRANEVASGFENDGYRTVVTERIVNELEVWRVSIGQFQTIEEAQSSAAALPEPYNTEHFIQRIQQ